MYTKDSKPSSSDQPTAGIFRDPHMGKRAAVLLAVGIPAALGLASFMTIGEGERFKACMLLGLVLLGLFAYVTSQTNKNTDRLLLAIIIAGAILRVGYAIYTPIDVRQHDVMYRHGHLDYILYLMENGKLPMSYDSQFYHPPLSHMAQALLLKGVSGFGVDVVSGKWLQIIPCLLSTFSILVIVQIAREFKLKESSVCLVAALTAFHPTFILLGGSVNNDMMMCFFFFLAILYTLRWYRKPTYKNILLLALFIGCSMMSKLSGAMIAFFTGGVFLLALFENRKNQQWLPYVKQMAAFIAVCAPLGLWHPIRNYLVLGQPIGFVPAPGLVGQDLYSGDHSLISRFLTFPLGQLLTSSYCDPRSDYNVWMFALKSSMFGEWEYPVNFLIPFGLLFLNLFLILLSLAAMVFVLRTKKWNPLLRFGLFVIWIFQIIPFISFNIRFPYGCTMDFRYMVPACVVGFLYLAAGRERLNPAFQSLLTGCVAVFCGFSALFFCLI